MGRADPRRKKEQFPVLYAMRGIDPVRFIPEDGECFADGLARFSASVEKIMDESSGDIAIVAHASVNRLFLCSLLQKRLRELYTIPQPYGCINEIIRDHGPPRVRRVGFLPADLRVVSNR
jgi:probable phosphoglycerate mutase